MNLKIGNKNISTKLIVNLTVTCLLLLPIYIDLMGTLSLVLGFSTKITTYFYYGMVWLLLITGIPEILRAMSSKVIFGVLLFGILLLSQYFLFPNNVDYLAPTSFMDVVTFSPRSLLAVVPYILIGLAVTDVEGLSQMLHLGSRIGVTAGTLSYLIAISAGHRIHYDDMANAYALCIVICVLIANYQKGDIYFLLMGFFSLLLAGTRGPIVCVIVAVLIKVLFLNVDNTKKILAIIAGVIAVIILQSELLYTILDIVEGFFNDLGVERLRIVEYFREDMIADTSGRDMLMEIVTNKLFEKPLVGYGVGGDRLILGNRYVHNLMMEIWVSYGVVVGTALLGWIGYWLTKGVFSKDTVFRSLVISLFCATVVKLFMSSSYLQSKEMFILLGICMSGSSLYAKIKTNREENTL